jgi:hypothetical protein
MPKIWADNKGGGSGYTPPIPATDIADGSVTNAEFQYIGGLTSDAQTQLNAKVGLTGDEAVGGVKEFTSDIKAAGIYEPGYTAGISFAPDFLLFLAGASIASLDPTGLTVAGGQINFNTPPGFNNEFQASAAITLTAANLPVQHVVPFGPGEDFYLPDLGSAQGAVFWVYNDSTSGFNFDIDADPLGSATLLGSPVTMTPGDLHEFVWITGSLQWVKTT